MMHTPHAAFNNRIRLAILWGLACLTATIASTRVAAQSLDRDLAGRRNIAILVYDNVQVLDFAGAFEVFSRFNRDNVFLVSKDGRPVKTWRGMTVTPAFAFGAHPKPDVIVIPGGDARDATRDSVILNWVRTAARDSAYVLSVCSGSAILLRAGLLDGRKATTFWRLQNSLRQQSAARHIAVVSDRLVVEDGRVVTAAGTGIEGALAVVGRLHGEAWRRATALHMEVNPDPDLEATHRSELADGNIPDVLDQFVPSDSAALMDYSGGRDAWNIHWRYRVRAPLEKTAASLENALRETAHWQLVQATTGSGWASTWDFVGPDGDHWRGTVDLSQRDGLVDLRTQVWRQESAPTRITTTPP